MMEVWDANCLMVLSVKKCAGSCAMCNDCCYPVCGLQKVKVNPHSLKYRSALEMLPWKGWSIVENSDARDQTPPAQETHFLHDQIIHVFTVSSREVAGKVRVS